MHELTLFTLKHCPHCLLAKKFLAELRAEDPRYAAIPIREIDEREEKKLADSYDYFLVPSFFLGREKLYEGHAEREDVRRVLDAVLSRA